MKKLQLENNSNYSLKTTLSNGYIVSLLILIRLSRKLKDKLLL